MFEFDRKASTREDHHDALGLTLVLGALVAIELWIFNGLGSSLRHLHSMTAVAFVPMALTAATLL